MNANTEWRDDGEAQKLIDAIHGRNDQMFCDEFIGEIIQIIAPSKIQIDIMDTRIPRADKVRLEVVGKSVDGWDFHSVVYGRTIGFAMRTCREELRMQSGR